MIDRAAFVSFESARVPARARGAALLSYRETLHRFVTFSCWLVEVHWPLPVENKSAVVGCSSLGNVTDGSWQFTHLNACFAFILHHALVTLHYHALARGAPCRLDKMASAGTEAWLGICRGADTDSEPIASSSSPKLDCRLRLAYGCRSWYNGLRDGTFRARVLAENQGPQRPPSLASGEVGQLTSAIGEPGEGHLTAHVATFVGERSVGGSDNGLSADGADGRDEMTPPPATRYKAYLQAQVSILATKTWRLSSLLTLGRCRDHH